jgi:hypothetical protein
MHDVVDDVTIPYHCPRMASQRWDLCLDHLREIHSYRLRPMVRFIEFAAFRSLK